MCGRSTFTPTDLSQWAGWHGPTNIVHNLHLDVYLNFIAILENFQKHVETGYFETGDKFELGGSKSAPYPLSGWGAGWPKSPLSGLTGFLS